MLHGEYKVPNGKLVVADIELFDDKIKSVSISGDFFLEPENALDTINQAIIGLSANASTKQISSKIESALDDSVAMIGFSAHAVAIAVRRALGKATSWDDHIFDVIELKTLDAAQHAALDEVIAESVAKGLRGPTLRFWDWDNSVIVIGTFQSVKNEVDLESAQKHKVKVVRRITGGGAMFMEPGNCITYSLVVPESLVDGMSTEQSYAFLDQWVLGALAELGIKAYYVPINDIASEQGKIGGAAQRRFSNGVIVHHATMAYDINADKMMEVLRIGKEKISDKGIASAKKRVDPMRSQTGMAREAIISAFLNYFKSNYQTRDSEYTQEELGKAQALLDEKFLTEKWLYRVP